MVLVRLLLVLLCRGGRLMEVLPPRLSGGDQFPRDAFKLSRGRIALRSNTCWVENWLTICDLLSPCSDHVCHKPLLWPGCVGRHRSPADHRWGGRSYLGGGPCTRRCLHHMHRHCHPPLQEVRISNEKLFVEQICNKPTTIIIHYNMHCIRMCVHVKSRSSFFLFL